MRSSNCRLSGEKSTSWGNTVITHLFLQMVCALCLTEGVIDKAFELLNSAVSQGKDLTGSLSSEEGQCLGLVEGDDNVFATNVEVDSHIKLAARLFGFKAEFKKTDGSAYSFCKV